MIGRLQPWHSDSPVMVSKPFIKEQTKNPSAKLCYEETWCSLSPFPPSQLKIRWWTMTRHNPPTINNPIKYAKNTKKHCRERTIMHPASSVIFCFLKTCFVVPFPFSHSRMARVLQSCRRHIHTLFAVISLFRQSGGIFASMENESWLNEVVSLRENAGGIWSVLE